MVKSSTDTHLGLALTPKKIGKPIFMSRNGRAYKEISGVELLQLKDKL